jgi:hypothetical protein
MTIQSRGFAPAERELKMEHSDTVTIPFKDKEVRIVLSGEFPMYNVADIHAIVGKGKLENAVKRAKKQFWIEEDEAGLETRHFPKFEEMGTPPQLWTDYEGAFFMSHRPMPNDPEKKLWRPVDAEFSNWFQIYVIDKLYMFLYGKESKFTFTVPYPFQVVQPLGPSREIKETTSMTIQRRGFAPAEMDLEMDYSAIVEYLYKGKELRVALNEEYPMFNVADINVILGNGNLEVAVARAKKAFWIEKDDSGSENKRYAKFEEDETTLQLWTDYPGVIFLSHYLVMGYDSEEIQQRPVDMEFSEWFEDTVMEDLYGPPEAGTQNQCICDECASLNK